MDQVAPSLPTRFPCWVRATYSWGGESKRDLGFVEGDLIECLNAGDGSWWMGRLRRDKRAMGLFPSNFVQVLDDGFRPVSRVTTPLALRASDPSPAKPKSSHRKPFQSYSKPTAPNPARTNEDSGSNLETPSPSPIKRGSRPQKQPSASSVSRRPSYTPPPASSIRREFPSRVPSPLPAYNGDSSPPPPAPPPHRVNYVVPARITPSPTPSMNDRYPTFSRGQSPAPPSPGVHGNTPSPLRDAMDDVMSSLHHMAMRQDAPSPLSERAPSPLDPWSPEAFEELRTKHVPQHYRQPFTSLGFQNSQYEEEHQVDSAYDSQRESPYRGHHDSPPNERYYDERNVRRMQKTLISPRPMNELFLPDDDMGPPPPPPPKMSSYQPRPQSSLDMVAMVTSNVEVNRQLKNRKSAYELGREVLGRTFTTKSSATNSSYGVQSVATNSSSSTQKTSQSVMSGHSAGGFSATSAGSMARRKGWGSISRKRPMSVMGNHKELPLGFDGRGSDRPPTPLSGVSYQSSYASRPKPGLASDWAGSVAESGGILGGLTAPKAKKSGFFKKLVESAKTGAASARSSIAAGQMEPPRSPIKSLLPNGVTAIAGGSAAKDMGLGSSTIDWVQIRRDVNRSNSVSRNERAERIERCQMMGFPVISPVEELYEAAEGDEGHDGLPINEPTNFQAANLQLVDKSARFVNSLPPMTNATSLAQGYICRPYRSDVQRLRAIFTWVSEKVAWEEDFEGEVDSRRVIQARRGCAEEVAVLVKEMCSTMGLQAEVVRGYLKSPGEDIDLDNIPRPNHWWNAVLVDREWRMMDCSLASPTNPKRGQYSSAGSQIAESGWFLPRPMEICFTHVPSLAEHQHICPPIASDILLALPCACPSYFKNGLYMADYDTSLLHIDNLELVQVQFYAPSDIECFAEVEARAYAYDTDGDMFESGDTITKRALAQAEWVGGQKRFTVKALLPSDEGRGILKVYAGKRGLMHSIRDNPHPLAFSVPIMHTGNNPAYEFFLRHPTPHAQRHDLYVSQPQCQRLAVNNTFVFAVRQHPSSLSNTSSDGSTSPCPSMRPSSAMSMISSSAASTTDCLSLAGSDSNGAQQQKPAKLAIQAPSGKILRLMRKSDHVTSNGGSGGGEAGDGGVWETIIKIGERGTWRGLVLADRSARWCVFGEWECV